MSGDPPRHPAGWPHPDARPCADCGHVWFAGERRHEYLDHQAPDHSAVEVLCLLCRRQRGLEQAADA